MLPRWQELYPGGSATSGVNPIDLEGTMRIRTFQLIATLLFIARLSTGQSIINTVAGTGTCCNSTDGRQATATWFTGMSAITLDRQGNLYIWEGASSRVRKV